MFDIIDVQLCMPLNVLLLYDTDFPTTPQATEPVTTQDRSSVQLPVLTVLQPTTAQNSVCLPPSNSLRASQRTEQAIQDSISFSSYASHLRRLYTSMSQSHTSQHWRQLPRCEFVQLAMIGSERQRRGNREEEMVRLAQQGRIETIQSYKEPIDLNNIFASQPLVMLPPPPHTRVILIEGAPGGGKSILALHICHRWAQGDVICSLGRFDLVILAYLRDQVVQNATTLADILPARNFELSQIVASQIQSCDGRNVLLVFDGWDEFPYHLQTNSLVSTIIRQPHKLFLHQTTVLITSRPVSSGNLLHLADRRVEILGFTQRQIREYIKKALDGNSTHIQKLIQHLEEHPVIEGYCYVPLHVAILVHIFLTMKGALPTTLHELFCNLVLCSIARELETHESESSTPVSCSLDDLPDELKSKLSNLSLLAYEGVMQDNVVFYEKDLKLVGLPADLPSLGLLQAVEGLTILSKSLSYNFLHPSVQELLAAYHISHIDSSKQLEVFERMFSSSRLQAVLHYYSGFTKLANPTVRDFISEYAQRQTHLKDLLPLLHCFYEAQEPSLCKIVAFHFCQSINISVELSPIDFLVIGYAVASLVSSDVQIHIEIQDELDQHKLKLFLDELSKFTVKVPTTEAFPRTLRLDLCNKSLIVSENLALLSSHLSQSLIITNLWINLCRFRSHNGLIQLWDALQTNCSLTELHITDGTVQFECKDYSYDCGSALKNMLQVNKSLSCLDFCKTIGFSYETRFIFQGLQHNTTIVHLNLSSTGLVATEETAQALTTMLQVNKTLTHLDLSSNRDFSISGVYSIFQALQHNTALAFLNLSRTTWTVTDDISEAFFAMLQVNKTLTHLDLSKNPNFSDSGAWIASQGLRHNTILLDLNLSDTGITDEGAEYIAEALNYNSALQKLNVSHNTINSYAVLVALLNHTSRVVS